MVGYAVSKALKLPLDIVVTRKVGHPDNPEYALGAVDADGASLLNKAETTQVNQAWLKKEIARQQQEARRRTALYRGGAAAQPIAGKTVIIVDDGIATGLSMRLAVRSVRAQKPAKIIVASPVAPPGVKQQLEEEGADELVVCELPDEFMGAIGAHYHSFPQVEDAEVMHLLKVAR